MKKNYILQDGSTIAAATAVEFVTELREGSRFDHDKTNEEYMRSFAERFLQYSGNILRTDSPELFLEDLIIVEYAKIQ